MIPCLFSLVVIKELFDFFLKFVLLLVQVLHHSVIRFLFFVVYSLKVRVLLAETSQFLDLRGQLSLLVLHLVLDLKHYAGNLLQGLFLLVVQDGVCFGDPLNLFLNLSVTRDAALLL